MRAEYTLVAQDRVHVDHFVRQRKTGKWLLTTHVDLDANIQFTALECSVPLAEIYANVRIEPEKLEGPRDVSSMPR